MGRTSATWWLIVVVVVATSAGARPVHAEDAELDALKATVTEMQKTIDAMKAKIERLERERAGTPAPAAQKTPAVMEAPAAVKAPAAAAPTAPAVVEAPAPEAPAPEAPAVAEAPEPGAEPAETTNEAKAARAYAERVLGSQGIGPQQDLDPSLRGFIPIPFTKALLRFNAKPRVDFTYDTVNPGDDNRFITAKIPVSGAAIQGGGPVFNANGKGSQLIVELRAPEAIGSPRFYYQMDFYGSGSGEFVPRVQQLFGKIYGLTVGQTFSPFEDPSVWPDTVDYEGPNSMIFARFPLVSYRQAIGEHWSVTGGVSQADTQAAGFRGSPATGINHAPDFAFNARWDDAALGHAQLSTVFRNLGARTAATGDGSAFGWGLNLGTSWAVPFPWLGTGSDVVLGQLTYGEGIGRYGNDAGFFDTDAAYDAAGNLVALPYFGGFAAYTHTWAPEWRSTATYGYVHVDNEPTQGPWAFRQTQYASLNVIWQLRERLSVGLEGLYGDNQKSGGASGNDFRTQVGVAYSLF